MDGNNDRWPAEKLVPVKPSNPFAIGEMVYVKNQGKLGIVSDTNEKASSGNGQSCDIVFEDEPGEWEIDNVHLLSCGSLPLKAALHRVQRLADTEKNEPAEKPAKIEPVIKMTNKLSMKIGDTSYSITHDGSGIATVKEHGKVANIPLKLLMRAADDWFLFNESEEKD